jgi:small nuclear ribonucleoprotein
MSQSPQDVLEMSLHSPVVVRLKDGRAYHGSLAGYDEHMNVVLGPSDVEMGPDTEATAVGDTIVIRGDNVVTIET